MPHILANSEAGYTDPVSNIADSAAYIYSGTLDDVTPPNLQEGLELVYEELGMDAENLILESVATGHGIK